MDEQIAAFAGLFRACAAALRKLGLPERAGHTVVVLDVAAQLEALATKLEQSIDGRGRSA